MWSILDRVKQFLPRRARRNRRTPTSSASYRPTLELLEERCVPADVTWMAGQTGNWSDGTKWVGGNAPGQADRAVFPSGVATIDQANITVADIRMEGGNITIPANRT